MSDIHTSLNRFREAYLTLLTIVENYPPEKREQSGACGYWSPKEVLAHLAGWLVEAAARYRLYDKDSAPARKHYDDFDAFNRESVDARGGMSWEEQINELRANYHVIEHHAGVVAARSPEPFKGYASWLDTLAQDCEEHTVELREFVTKEPV